MTSPNQLANAIRVLSMDAVQQAKSGHPGAPMGMADIAQALWQEYLNHNPSDPNWFNRDRFVLSNGHGSMLLYALLHLTGYDLPIEELHNFRQLGSKTPGHPEFDYTPGVETTTGPLGQGLANGVGMALAEHILAAQFNQPGFNLVDHYTYVFAGDGCLMEGISHEVCSLAGTLGLGKLIVFYDDNGISIDGKVASWFKDDTPKRFEAYGWHVIPKVDGHNLVEIKAAIELARQRVDAPTLICCQTVIGFGAPAMQGTHEVHGKPLGEAEIQAARARLNWPHAPFVIPEEIYQAWDAKAKGARIQAAWTELLTRYEQAYPELAQQFRRRIQGELPEDWTELCQRLNASLANAGNVATRKASQLCLDVLAPGLPELLGGSADLTDSNNTAWKGAMAVNEIASGRYIHYGVREFGMTAIMNGLALHGGFIPFGGTFLVFMDYARNAVRMAALMKQRVILVYSHDSIGLGEDGPTHQPVEHLTSLRTIPNVSSWRPADAFETAIAWQRALARANGPTALVLSRQTLPVIKRTPEQAKSVARGGYIVKACEGVPRLLLIATGSEVQLAIAAAEVLQKESVAVQVVSMPSPDTFDHQEAEYKRRVLPREVRARIAVEAGSTDYWCRYVGREGIVIGLDRFGESAPAEALYKYFGITVDSVVAAGRRLLVQFSNGG